MPPKAQAVIGASARYKVLYGGRGSGKSWSFADALIARAHQSRIRILCTREIQNSIRDSVHRLLSDRIAALGLDKDFNIQKESITSFTGSEFIFKGLRHNISEIKSTESVDICWVEEAEKVPEESWNVLIPTIRREDSEIWISFNPEDENSATYQRFIARQPDNCISSLLTYEDNDFFPEVLRKEMEYDKRVDFDKYEYIWLGKPKGYSQDIIFKGKVVEEEFEDPPENTQLFFGLDFGFSTDPTALVRCHITGDDESPRTLWINNEAYGHGVEIDELETFISSVDGSRRWKIIADSARPDTISYLKQRGFDIVGAEKGKGSVEDGIQFLRSFERIVIHPRCKGTLKDFMNYRWKRDRVTNEILPIPKEGSDHAPDACRYALEKWIKKKTTIWDVL